MKISITLKFFINLLILYILISWTQLSLVGAQTIEPDNVSRTEQLHLIEDFNQRLTPNERAWLKRNSILKVAVKNGWMPIEFKLESEDHRGISIDYLNKLSSILQVKFEIINYVDNLEPANADIISGVANRNLRNSNFRLLDQPYLVFPLAIYTNKLKKNSSKIKSIEDLKNSNVAIFKGGQIGQKIKENYPNLRLT